MDWVLWVALGFGGLGIVLAIVAYVSICLELRRAKQWLIVRKQQEAKCANMQRCYRIMDRVVHG